MKLKKTRRQRSEQIQQVNAAMGDLLGMIQWRKEHPTATWAEIEVAVDEQINQVRAQMLQDLVQMGEEQLWKQQPVEEPTTNGELAETHPGRLDTGVLERAPRSAFAATADDLSLRSGSCSAACSSPQHCLLLASALFEASSFHLCTHA